MNMRQRIAKKIILASDPHAFDDGTLLAEVEQHECLANDPERCSGGRRSRRLADRGICRSSSSDCSSMPGFGVLLHGSCLDW